MGKRTKADRKLQIAAFIRQVHENAENAPNIDSSRQHKRTAAADESVYESYILHESVYGKDIIHESNTVKVNCSTEKGRARMRMLPRESVPLPSVIEPYTEAQKSHRAVRLAYLKRYKAACKARNLGGG